MVKKPCCVRTCPSPEQVGQVAGSDPPREPVPEHCSQESDRETDIVRRVPLKAVSSGNCRL